MQRPSITNGAAMRRTSLILSAVILASACHTDATDATAPVPPLVAPQPPAPAVLTGLKVTPHTIALFPGMTTPISLVAVDQRGQQLVWADDAVTYSSSNPAVVTVDNRGILAAISAGTAVIGIALTLNGVTATGGVRTDVLEFRPGNYQLTAPITESGWGSGSYTALLTVWQDSSLTGAGAPTGAFLNLRLVWLDGAAEESVPYGIVEYNVDVLGRLRVQLVAGQIVRWSGSIESSLDDSFGGSFDVGDGPGGLFTAKRGGH